jgi:4-amino-4-deoxy-L-arabinose transferase-like glycosyltransferase
MPALYFALQKLFFLLFGESASHVKLSTMPYIAVTAGALFFISRRLLGTVAGLAAVGIYAILAPSVYADTFGTTISASMAFFMLFFAASIVNLRRQEYGTALLAGVTCAFCALAAPTSYVAIPLLFAFPLLSLRCLPLRTVVRGLGVSLAGFALVLLPFVAGAARSKNYFAERLVRVAPVVAPLFGVTLSPEEIEPPGPGVVAKWKLMTSYLWKDDAGGCCGFNFGQAALLDPVTGILALAGLALGFRLRGIGLEWTMAVSVVAASLFALGFANPPPMITRYSLLLPFVALFLAAPVALLLRDGARGPRAVRWLAAVVLLAGIATANVLHFRFALKRDTAGGRGEYEDIKVARYLQKTFPGHDVKVAAFGGFHLGYTLHFFLPGVDIETDYHQQLLDRLKESQSHDYVFVVLFPDEFNGKFLKVDPTGVVVTGISRHYSLFVSRELARSVGLVSAKAPPGTPPEAPATPVGPVSPASAASTG